MSHKRLAVVVMNGISGDSRVQKIAQSASEGGYITLLLGIGSPFLHEHLSPTLTYKVVEHRKAARKRFANKIFAFFKFFGIDPKLGVKSYLENLTQLRILELIPELVDFAPNLIHANDPDTLRLAFEYKLNYPDTKIVYDAHEYILGAVRPSMGWNDFMSGEEGAFISDVDGIITVSETIASSLTKNYELDSFPHVIRNLPSSSDNKVGKDIVRDCNLNPGDNLGVYLGNITSARGLDVIPNSLFRISNLHIALVTKTSAELDSLISEAMRLNVADRLHVLPYVSHDLITCYIKSAKFGIAPYANEINHNMSLPSKFYEYLVAGIPIVSSELPESSKFLNVNKVGVLFQANNEQSFCDAVMMVLETREELLREIKNLDMTDFTWESQEQKLLDIYKEILA